MDSAVATKRRGFGSTHTQRLMTKLADGGEVKGELFADVGLQLGGVKSYLKRLKLLVIFLPA